jgi:hypothetical protein
MSQLTYSTAAAIRTRASSLQDVSVVVWVALGAAIIGTVVVLALTLPNSDNEPSGTAASNQRSQPAQVNRRFDGGPNEGTRGVSRNVESAGVRFDGGPQEGTRGALVIRSTPAVSLTRFDGGPNEGTRGGQVVTPTEGVRFDGGPDEGTRGQ